jgi:competence CoiA-like predicted nuclease
MPFSAEVRNGDGVWRRVDITTMAAPKLELADCEKRCPDTDCGCELIVKHGAITAPHFAHRRGGQTPGCAFAGGGETPEHLAAKRAILGRLRSNALYKGAHLEPERILRDGLLKRIADVYVEFPDGSIEVHEAQLSRTSTRECQQRTDDYETLGVELVIWWFGGANRADTTLQQWARTSCGVVGTLDFSVQPVAI